MSNGIGPTSLILMVLTCSTGSAQLVDRLPAFVPGDVNADRTIDVADASYLLSYLFLQGGAPAPLLCTDGSVEASSADVNRDGSIDLSDPVQVLAWLFLGKGPLPGECGTVDGGGASAAIRVPLAAVAGPVVFTEPPERVNQNRDGDRVIVLRFGQAGPITGDVEGNVVWEGTSNLDLERGESEVHGSFRIEGTWNGRSGAWEGQYRGTFNLFGAESPRPQLETFVGQGSGELAGTRVMGVWIPVAPGSDTFIMDGVVLVPAP